MNMSVQPLPSLRQLKSLHWYSRWIPGSARTQYSAAQGLEHHRVLWNTQTRADAHTKKEERNSLKCTGINPKQDSVSICAIICDDNVRMNKAGQDISNETACLT